MKKSKNSNFSFKKLKKKRFKKICFDFVIFEKSFLVIDR